MYYTLYINTVLKLLYVIEPNKKIKIQSYKDKIIIKALKKDQ